MKLHKVFFIILRATSLLCALVIQTNAFKQPQKIKREAWLPLFLTLILLP